MRLLKYAAMTPASGVLGYERKARKADERAARRAAEAGEPDLDACPAQNTTAVSNELIRECLLQISARLTAMERELSYPQQEACQLRVIVDNAKLERGQVQREIDALPIRQFEENLTPDQLADRRRMLRARRDGIAAELVREEARFDGFQDQIVNIQKEVLRELVALRDLYLLRVAHYSSHLTAHHPDPDRGRLGRWAKGLSEQAAAELNSAICDLMSPAWRDIVENALSLSSHRTLSSHSSLSTDSRNPRSA